MNSLLLLLLLPRSLQPGVRQSAEVLTFFSSSSPHSILTFHLKKVCLNRLIKDQPGSAKIFIEEHKTLLHRGVVRMSKLEKWQKQHRKIYELLLENPRIEATKLSKEIGLTHDTVSARLKNIFDKGFIIGPQIRKKSFKNFKEYEYFVDCQDPLEFFLQHYRNQNIVYLARMEGSPNIWMTSKKEIDIEGDVLVGGLRSDYHMSIPPEYSWETSIGNLNERAEKFNKKDYQQKGTLENHWDETIEWSTDDEALFREFKYEGFSTSIVDPCSRTPMEISCNACNEPETTNTLEGEAFIPYFFKYLLIVSLKNNDPFGSS